MKYLGIDYGEKHVGVAMADGLLATPLDTFETSQALALIKRIIEKDKFTKIIIGDCPDSFLQNLIELGIDVCQTDETLSSHDARNKLLHRTPKKRQELEHSVAAAIILQTWLDSRG